MILSLRIPNHSSHWTRYSVFPELHRAATGFPCENSSGPGTRFRMSNVRGFSTRSLWKESLGWLGVIQEVYWLPNQQLLGHLKILKVIPNFFRHPSWESFMGPSPNFWFPGSCSVFVWNAWNGNPCLTDPVTDPTKWQPVQPTNPNVSLQMQHRVWMPQNPTFQEWISSPSDPVSVANYSKHLTSKTKSLIQKLVFKGFQAHIFSQKNISKPSRTFPLKKNNLAKCINHPIDSAQKTSEPTRKHLEKRECQSLVNSLGAKSRAANAQAKRAKSCMDFMCGNSSWSD